MALPAAPSGPSVKPPESRPRACFSLRMFYHVLSPLWSVQYESKVLQARALSVIPAEQLRAAAEEAAAISVRMQEQPPLAAEDALARELLAWFKTSFFQWVRHTGLGFVHRVSYDRPPM